MTIICIYTWLQRPCGLLSWTSRARPWSWWRAAWATKPTWAGERWFRHPRPFPSCEPTGWAWAPRSLVTHTCRRCCPRSYGSLYSSNTWKNIECKYYKQIFSAKIHLWLLYVKTGMSTWRPHRLFNAARSDLFWSLIEKYHKIMLFNFISSINIILNV